MSVLVWLHEDSVQVNDPALAAHPSAPAVWVWDDAALRDDRYSLKRILFLYECVIETRAEIWRGDTVKVLIQRAEALKATSVTVTESINPRFSAIVRELRKGLPVEVLQPPAFVPRKLDTDLRRFARFWKKAEPYAFGRRPA